ncbi:MAG TPA: glycosyltransferase [Solirubrobacteraceae bacterium]|nr:glycosyltransferase [Solirubrobacteraceae bacterium]
MPADAPPARALKLLVVHSELPHPDRDACSLRLFRIVELLAADGHHITFLGRGGLRQERYAAMLLALGVEVVHPVDPERLGALRGWRPSQWSIPMLDVPDLLERGAFDVAWLSLYDVAEQYLPLIRRHAPGTRVIVDSSDIQWVRQHRGAELAGDAEALAAAERTRERERAVYSAADLNVAISPADAQATRELAPDVPLAVVSMAQSFAPVSVERAGRAGVVFVGNFHHAPNVDAVLHFHHAIWPEIRAALPDAHLTLVGTAPPPEVEALAAGDVTVTGWVPSVAPYLERALVSVAPLRYGAGVKGKIAEAIAAGLPVVTTAIGAEGMELLDGEHALVADEPAAFARAVIALHEDAELWSRIARQAPPHLDAVMGSAVARAGLREALRAVAPPSADAPPSLPGRPTRRRAEVAVAIHPAIDAPTLAHQLSRVNAALAGEAVDLLVIAAGHDGATAQTLAAAHGGRLLRCTEHRGRAEFIELALEATRAPVLVTLGTLALPRPGFLAPLVRAVSGGASFAGPLLDGAAGLRVAADGSLWPRDPERHELDALPLDCLAASRETWCAAPLRLSPREGHIEHQLAQWAASRGALAVCPEATVERVDAGPVSVVICTRDRAQELPDAVALLVACGATKGRGEVIIVDNGSTDATPELAAELAAAHPGVRVVREERAGLSHARNAGARAASNDQICYLDDDARPAPGWRSSLAWALRLHGVASAGGPICGLWPAARPEGWPPPGLEGTLSILDAGDSIRALDPPEIIYGANWAIRRDALAATGGFDSHLGYSPEVRIGGEEVAIAWRLYLRRLGITLYLPEAAVGHRIDEGRLHDGFVVERMFKVGIEHAHLRAEREGKGQARMLAEADQAAGQLLRLVALEGEMSLEEALARVQGAPLPLRDRATASEALGLLGATVLLLGEHEVEIHELRLRLRPEHLRGLLEPVATAVGP